MSKKNYPEARTFFADTRFERMARRPSGMTRAQALERAQIQVDELKSDFTIWLDRELQELNAALSKVESNSSDKLSLECADRSCSHLRDVGTTMGYELITFVASNLCKILDAIKAGAAYDKETIDCHVDALFLARTDQYRHLRPEQVPEMASGLRRVVALASKTPAHKSK